jgi:hypothetical protein
VLGGWSGGYLDGNSWKLSSGTNGFDYDHETFCYHFPQVSGSTYICCASSYGFTGFTSSILAGWHRKLGEDAHLIEVMDEKTAFASLKYL